MNRRPGVSILEVMFAILVATVGLLGAVAVFPVASSMARKGRINDVAASSGRSAFHDLDARGMRRPDNWIGYTSNWDFPAAGPSLPAGYTSVSPVLLKQQPPNPPVLSPGIRWPLGTAFCIDPRVIARAGTPAIAASVSLFPAVGRQPIANVPNAHPNSVDPRMFRISLTSGLRDGFGNLIYATPMGQLQADGIFQFEDDLAYERSDEDRSLPAVQTYDVIGGTPPNPLAKRLSEGHFTWMATITPKTEMVETIVNNQILFGAKPTDEYVLSVVVYHDRDMEDGERLLAGTLQGDGATGGELMLTDNSPDQLKLKSGDWLMLGGVYSYAQFNPQGQKIADQLSNVPRFGWYRVSDVDDVEQVTGNPATRYATIVGADWNMNASDPRKGPLQSFQQAGQWRTIQTGHVQVTIVENVVAVYEKTIRLEYGTAF